MDHCQGSDIILFNIWNFWKFWSLLHDNKTIVMNHRDADTVQNEYLPTAKFG